MGVPGPGRAGRPRAGHLGRARPRVLGAVAEPAAGELGARLRGDAQAAPGDRVLAAGGRLHGPLDAQGWRLDATRESPAQPAWHHGPDPPGDGHRRGLTAWIVKLHASP